MGYLSFKNGKKAVENLANQLGEYLLTLINNILDLSKIEAGTITLNLSNFDLYGLLDELEDMFDLKAETKGLQLNFDYTEELSRYICADEIRSSNFCRRSSFISS